MGKYTNPNHRCATVGCAHFVSDHGWIDDRSDAEKLAGAPHANEQDRGACHQCACKDYADSGSEELDNSDASTRELKKLRAEKAAADTNELAALRAEKAAKAGA